MKAGNKTTKSGHRLDLPEHIPRTQQPITKICTVCNKPFTAYKSTTQYCSPVCYRRDYYAKRKINESASVVADTDSQKATDQKVSSSSEKPDTASEIIYATDIYDLISVREAARRLNVTPPTIYNWEKAGYVDILHLTSRKSYVRWSLILAFFDEHKGINGMPVPEVKAVLYPRKKAVVQAKKIPESFVLKKPMPTKEPDWLNVEQASRRYGYSPSTIYTYGCHYSVTRKKEGREVLYLRSDFDKALNYQPKSVKSRKTA